METEDAAGEDDSMSTEDDGETAYSSSFICHN